MDKTRSEMKDDNDNESILTLLPEYRASDPRQGRDLSPAPSYRTQDPTIKPAATLPAIGSAVTTRNDTGTANAASGRFLGLWKWRGWRTARAVSHQLETGSPQLDTRSPQSDRRSPQLEIGSLQLNTDLHNAMTIAWRDNDVEAFNRALHDPTRFMQRKARLMGDILHLSIRYKRSEGIIASLMDLGVPLDALYLNPSFSQAGSGTGDTILHTACRYWKESLWMFVAARLRDAHLFDVMIHMTGINDDTPLCIAAESGNEPLTTTLLKSGAIVNAQAIRKCKDSMVRVLIERAELMNEVSDALASRDDLFKLAGPLEDNGLRKRIVGSGLLKANAENIAKAIHFWNSGLAKDLLTISAPKTGLSCHLVAVFYGDVKSIARLIRSQSMVDAGEAQGYTAKFMTICFQNTPKLLEKPRKEKLTAISNHYHDMARLFDKNHSKYIYVDRAGSIKFAHVDDLDVQLCELTLKAFTDILFEYRYRNEYIELFQEEGKALKAGMGWGANSAKNIECLLL